MLIFTGTLFFCHIANTFLQNISRETVAVTELNSTLKILADAVSIPFHSPEFKNKLSSAIKYISNKPFGWWVLLKAVEPAEKETLCAVCSVCEALFVSLRAGRSLVLSPLSHGARLRSSWLKGGFVAVMFFWIPLQAWCPLCVSVCRTWHCFHVSVQNPHGYSCSVLSFPLTLIFVPLLTLCH